jgi:hypothetical protein
MFLECADVNGFGCRSATSKEKVEDIDLVIWDKENELKAFAVSLKKTILKKSKRRKHLWGWVELRDRYGEDGWLYKKCTFVVYERKSDFVLIFKKDFRNWIQAKNLARWDLPFVNDSWSAGNRLFRRKNTKEAIFHVKISDALKNCRHHIWKKEQENL